MISFTVSKDWNTALLDFNGRVTRLHAARSRLCRNCELRRQTDGYGAQACRLLYLAAPETTLFCMDRPDRKFISWKKIPERRARNV